jgi:selenoprotein W-related protein
MADKPVVSIEYCQVCNFRGRAAWLAQELLSTLEGDLAGVTLIPGRGGIFEVRVDGETVFSHEREGRFPEPRELKDAVLTKLGRSPASRHN